MRCKISQQKKYEEKNPKRKAYWKVANWKNKVLFIFKNKK